MTEFDPTQIDHLEESYAEFAGAHYLYREAQAAVRRGEGESSAEEVAKMRAWARECIANIRSERQKVGASANQTAEGAWGSEHFVWLDSLLGDDVARVKRHVSVLGFDD